MLEVLVEGLGSREVQAEAAEGGALGRVDRQVGDVDEVARVEIDVLVIQAQLVPELCRFRRCDLLGVLFHGVRRPVEHTARVDIHLLLPHQAAERHQIRRVAGVELEGPAKRLVRLQALAEVRLHAARQLGEDAAQ